MKATFLKNWLRMAGMLAAFTISMASHADKIYFVHNDHLGTPQVITDESKNVVWEVDRDPWGNITNVISNTLPNHVSLPGMLEENETNINYNYQRYYWSQLGLYSSADKLDVLGRANDPELWMVEELGAIQLPEQILMNHLYGYAEQNPVMNSDFYGLISGVHCGSDGCESLEDDCGCLAKAFLGWEEAAVAGAAVATAGIVKKPRKGIAGGGRSGDKTSAWSSAVSKVNKYAGKGAITRAARNAGRIVGKAVPGVGTAVMLYDATVYNQCMKECKECQDEK